MQPYPPFPPDVELALLNFLFAGDLHAALAEVGRWKSGWGKSDPEKGTFELTLPLGPLGLTLKAKPPQIERFDEITQKQLRVMAVMTLFAGGEQYSGSHRWAPGAAEWDSWKVPVMLARMCRFWGDSAYRHMVAMKSGMTRKRIIGRKHKVSRDPAATCEFCMSLRGSEYLPIDAEFEQGIIFPPFRGCTQTQYGCRCMLEFA